MKNTLLNMILVLGGITLIASAGVGMVYKVTEEPIRAAKEANTKLALGDVLPEFDTSTTSAMQLDGINMTVYTAEKEGKTVGYAVQTATKNGFSGEFKLMVGFTPDGKVYNVKVLEHLETPGLGDKMAADGNPLFASFAGKNPSQMKLAVTKDGGDVDALTAATITSRAYVDAVARAFNALMQQTGGQSVEADVDAESGATQVDGESGATSTDATTGATELKEGKEDGNE